MTHHGKTNKSRKVPRRFKDEDSTDPTCRPLAERFRNLQGGFDKLRHQLQHDARVYAFGENLVNTLALSFLIGSSLFLQVTRPSITFRTSSKFGQVGPMTAELGALKRLEKSS